MRRVKDRRGVVHYGNPADPMRTLCAADAFDIQSELGKFTRVTCTFNLQPKANEETQA